MRISGAILILTTGCLAADGVVTSIAGVGPSQIDLVEGRRATDAVFGEVHALAFGSDGDLFAGAQRLLVRIDREGVAHSVAGAGTLGSMDGMAGDNIASGSLPVAFPRGLAYAADGSLYFSDAGLQTVRRISPDGVVTTVVPFSAGYVSPRAVALDKVGNLYIAVLGNRSENTLRGAILKLTPEGKIARLDLRNPDQTPAFLNQPEGLTVDSSGALYVTEYAGHRARKVVEGVVTTVAGTGNAGFSGDGGPASEAELRGPSGVAVAGDGTLFISDTLNNRIRVVAPGGVIDTLRWTAPSGEVAFLLSAPAHILLDQATRAVYVAEYLGRRVRKIEAGVITTIAGNGERVTWSGDVGDGGPALLAHLNAPEGIAMCAGRLYVADTSNALIRILTPDGWIDSVAGNGQVQDAAGDGGQAREVSIGLPTAVACDGRGNVYIADRGRPRILKAAPGGSITTILGDGSFNNPDLRDPRGVAVDGAGNVFVTERSYSRVVKVTPEGSRIVMWSGRQGVDFPQAIAVDFQGRPYFSVNALNAATVKRVEAEGALTHIAGSGKACEGDILYVDVAPAKDADLCFVSGLAFDAQGRLHMSTVENVLRIDLDGTVRRVAGGEQSTATGPLPLGDGGPARAANLNGVSGIAMDEEGIYFPQFIHNRVRRISFTSH